MRVARARRRTLRGERGRLARLARGARGVREPPTPAYRELLQRTRPRWRQARPKLQRLTMSVCLTLHTAEPIAAAAQKKVPTLSSPDHTRAAPRATETACVAASATDGASHPASPRPARCTRRRRPPPRARRVWPPKNACILNIPRTRVFGAQAAAARCRAGKAPPHPARRARARRAARHACCQRARSAVHTPPWPHDGASAQRRRWRRRCGSRRRRRRERRGGGHAGQRRRRRRHHPLLAVAAFRRVRVRRRVPLRPSCGPCRVAAATNAAEALRGRGGRRRGGQALTPCQPRQSGRLQEMAARRGGAGRGCTRAGSRDTWLAQLGGCPGCRGR